MVLLRQGTRVLGHSGGHPDGQQLLPATAAGPLRVLPHHLRDTSHPLLPQLPRRLPPHGPTQRYLSGHWRHGIHGLRHDPGDEQILPLRGPPRLLGPRLRPGRPQTLQRGGVRCRRLPRGPLLRVRRDLQLHGAGARRAAVARVRHGRAADQAGRAHAAPGAVELPVPRHAGRQLPVQPPGADDAAGGPGVRGAGDGLRYLHAAGEISEDEKGRALWHHLAHVCGGQETVRKMFGKR
mmetsp:Transcript_35488/g.69853  ORF Transcript_35488/g.69853 Transcript_35488/m.69853 type:complete len:237 (-) Transcript_35488:61-771(-)